MESPIEVPLEIFKGLERIKGTGINMNAFHQVLAQAERMEDLVLSHWLRTNMKYYIQSTYYGLVPEGEQYII